MFLVLDQLHTVTGFDNKLKLGFYSNEVRNVKKDVLEVRFDKKVVATGLWADIKKENDLFTYTKSVYIAFYDENKELQIGNIKMAGSSLSQLSEDTIKANYDEALINAKVKAKTEKIDISQVPVESYSSEFLRSIGWINFSNQFTEKEMAQIAVIWTDKIADKNGKVDFLRPIFKANHKISEKSNEESLKLDRELQEYLDWYLEETKIENGVISPSHHVTAAQLGLLRNLSNETGDLEYDVARLVSENAHELYDNLSSNQASDAIEYLKGRVEPETEHASVQDADADDDIAF
jgi:hypothetical protein